jgi:hypothetical protein
MRTLYAYHYPDGDNPHEVVLELGDDDEQAWDQRRREEVGEFDPDDEGGWLRVTDLNTGDAVDVRTVPCGLGCRCAAEARPA